MRTDIIFGKILMAVAIALLEIHPKHFPSIDPSARNMSLLHNESFNSMGYNLICHWNF
jgi:hypothetical protein